MFNDEKYRYARNLAAGPLWSDMASLPKAFDMAEPWRLDFAREFKSSSHHARRDYRGIFSSAPVGPSRPRRARWSCRSFRQRTDRGASLRSSFGQSIS